MDALRLAHRWDELVGNRSVIVVAKKLEFIGREGAFQQAAQQRRIWRIWRWIGRRRGWLLTCFPPDNLCLQFSDVPANGTQLDLQVKAGEDVTAEEYSRLRLEGQVLLLLLQQKAQHVEIEMAQV